MGRAEKNCANCVHGCETPMGMKPVYGYGGMMLVCKRPNARKKKGTMNLVAPLHKCRCWEAKEAATGE